MLVDNLVLVLMLILGLIAANQLVAASAGFLLLFRVLRLQGVLQVISDRALDWGLMLLLMAILAPVAQRPPSFNEISEQLRSPAVLLAVVGGAAATRLQGSGLQLLKQRPDVILGLLIGTVVGVFFLDGIPVGPLTGAGLTAALLLLLQWL